MNLNLLENLFKICKERDIKVILTSPPTIKDYANTLGVLYNPTLKELMKTYEVDSIDFNDGRKKYEKICFLIIIIYLLQELMKFHLKWLNF